MDIKQRLQFTHAGMDPSVLVQLCREARAEIERVEASHCKAVSSARQVEAAERIADTLERIEKRMHTRWNLL